jgi:MFS family permease
MTMDTAQGLPRIWNRAYLLLFGVNVLTNVSFYMIFTTLALYLQEEGMNVAVAGVVIGAMPLAAMFMRPFSGWITDAFDRRTLLLFFLVLNSLCMAMYAMVESDAGYMILRIVHGIGFCMMTTVTMALIVDYIPPSRLSEGMGYFGVTQTIAMAVGPAIGLALSQWLGYEWMFRMAAAFIVFPILGLMRLSGGANSRPEASASRLRQKLRLKPGDLFVKEAVLVSVISFAIASLNGIESSYIALYGAQFQLSNIGWYFTLSAITLMIARIWLGKLSDRYGLSAVLYPALFAIGSSFVLLASISTAYAMVMFALAAVIKALGVGVLQPALQAQAVKHVDPERRGAAVSTYFVGSDLGQATAPALAGSLIGFAGYSFMFVVYTLPILGVAVLYAAVSFRKGRRS